MTAALVMMCCSATSPALQPIDDLYWPETGKFPGYPAEPDERKVRFSIFGGIDRDSNLFRLSDRVDPQTAIGSTEKADTLSRLGVGLKADLPASRQRLVLDLQAVMHDYNRFDLLDHNEYLASGTWKWQAGSNWSGDAGYAKRRYLSPLSEIQAPIKDMVTEDRAFFGAGFMLTPRWKLRGAADWIKWDHDEPTRDSLDARIVSGTVGLDYVTPPGNYVGGQFKYSDGEYPHQEPVAGGFVDNRFKEYEASLVAHWIATGKSSFDARAGYTSRQHDQLPQRDFDGFTGRLNYDWYIASKTLLNFAIWRELRSSEDISASYVLAEGWSVGPAWAPTSKIVLQARYIREDRDYRGDPGFVLTGGTQREDTFRGIYLSAGYTPRRNIRLSLEIERGNRDSNTLNRDYDYSAVSGNAKIRF